MPLFAFRRRLALPLRRSDRVVLDAVGRAGTYQDFGPSLSLDDPARLGIQHTRLQRRSQQRIQHAAQQSPDRDPQDPEDFVKEVPAAALARHEDAPDGAAADRAEGEEEGGGEGDAEGAGGAGEDARERDAAVRARRDGAEGVGD